MIGALLSAAARYVVQDIVIGYIQTRFSSGAEPASDAEQTDLAAQIEPDAGAGTWDGLSSWLEE